MYSNIKIVQINIYTDFYCIFSNTVQVKIAFSNQPTL